MIPDLFPCLLPCNASFTSYRGFITIKNQEYAFSFDVAPESPLTSAVMKGDPTLTRYLSEHQAVIQSMLAECSTIYDFLTRLHSFLSKVMIDEEIEIPTIASSRQWHSVIEQLEELQWKGLTAVDSNTNTLIFTLTDADQRAIELSIILGSFTRPYYVTEFPDAKLRRISCAGLSIKAILADVQSKLEMFREFWRQMDDIDKHLWVLEPEKPRRYDVFRRIALGSHCSLLLQVNPYHPCDPPECRFLGSDAKVSEYRNSLDQRVSHWNKSNSLIENLKYVLNQEFPSRVSNGSSSYDSHCGICYSLHLNNKLPDKTCNNVKCSQPFHAICILEWLRTLPTSKQSFGRWSGECPYCSIDISVNEMDI